MRKAKTIAILLLAFSLAGLSAYAAGDSRAGKQFFRSYCKSCHVRGGEAPELSPSVKTQSQWRRFFRRDRHRDYPEVWDKMRDDERKNIWRFLYENALDADRPETCG